MADNTHHVLERLPRHGQALRERILIDPDFRLLCCDYGTALEALRRWEASDDRHRQVRIAEFRALLAELEQEILTEIGVV